MKKAIILVLLLAVQTVIPLMAQKYRVTNITRTRIVMDDKYVQDAEAMEYLKPYRHDIDSIMSPVMGHTVKYMKSYAPESELSNLLADIMAWCGCKYNEKPDFGMYNLGGIRAALPEGTITFGDINDMAPFENKIYFLSLKGSQVLQLCEQLARKPAGISHGLEIVAKGKTLESARLNGEPIDPERTYRIATLDYLAQGNDGYTVLGEGFDANGPKDNSANTRYLIAEYFKEMTSQGKAVDSNIEGRFIVK